jgi:hypothetical protein
MSKNDQSKDNASKGSSGSANRADQHDAYNRSREPSDSRYGWNSQDTIDKDAHTNLGKLVLHQIHLYDITYVNFHYLL